MEAAGLDLSICMPTYNHERFLRQAVESVAAQDTEFSIELIIGEDSSPDGTRDLLLELADEHPGLVKPVLHGSNLGGPGNMRELYAQCTGEFVAILEGDDYWTYPGKVQAQIEILRGDPRIASVFHNVSVIYEDSRRESHPHIAEMEKHDFDLSDILRSCFIPTCSTMFRRSNFSHIPNWCAEVTMGDWIIHCRNAQHGLTHYIDETWATYRIHSGGVWSTLGALSRAEDSVKACRLLGRQLGLAHHRSLRTLLASQHWKLARGYATERRMFASLRELALLFGSLPLVEYPAQFSWLVGLSRPSRLGVRLHGD